ncbi:MAG: ABC transporter substrate-binding protein, partial [Pyrinomonadaceae bacterium]
MKKARDTAFLFATSLAMAVGVAHAEVVKIGQIEAKTGPFASYGLMNIRGAAVAVDQINKAGGFTVNGKTYTLEMESEDTRGDPKEGLIQIKRLLEQEKVKFIFGPGTSGVFATVQPYAQRMNGKFIWMNGASRGHSIIGTPNNEYYIRTWNWVSGKNGTGTRLTQYVKKVLAPKKIAMLFPNHEGGKVTAQVVTEILKENKVDSVVEFYDVSVKDFGPILSKLASQGADVLVPGLGSDEAAASDIVRQAAEGKYFTKFVAYNGGVLAPALRNKDLIDAYIFDTPKYFPLAEKTEPKVKQFVTDYKNFYKEEFPYSLAATCVTVCYDHVFMLVKA